MLDLGRLQRLKLSARPLGQRLVGNLVLWPNYRLPPQVKIRLLGQENLPREPVIYAMNHTDRYNYWPFQYQLWRDADRFTATWVKGKYYENEAMGWFLERTNNLPTVSRGYIVSRDFVNVVGRPPRDDEYEVLKRLVDAAVARAGGEATPPEAADVTAGGAALQRVLTVPRDMLGRPFDPHRERYADAVLGLFDQMMARFLELHTEAFQLGLDLLIFPQGTRSIRLTPGHIGLAQIALAYDRPIVPVGCSGSDGCYPGGSPFARRGRITYRIGEPISRDDLVAYRPSEPFVPFSPAAEVRHRATFQGLVDEVMNRINGLVDARYQFGDDTTELGASGAKRFV